MDKKNGSKGEGMLVEEKVKDIIVEYLGVRKEEVKMESNLSYDLDADSLDAAELAMALEDEFGIEIPDEDTEKLKTVENTVEYINKVIGSVET